MTKYIAIRGSKDKKLLFIGKLLETAPIPDAHDQERWLLSGYFHFVGDKWRFLTRDILQAEEELFVVSKLSEQEHFLLLLREKLDVEEFKEEDQS